MQYRNRRCEKHYSVFVILVLTIFTSFCQAQQDFRPGFIITLTGDTIKGHIDYRPPISNASRCHFRRENSLEISKFSPEEINAYRYNDSKYYISKELTIGGITSRHFLEYLVDGVVELYYLASKFKDAYYIEKEGIFYEVINEDRTFRKDNKIYKSVKKEYVGTLKYLMRETPDLFDKIDKSDFNHKDFVALSQEYHESICPDYDCITYVKSSDKLHDIKWRIHPGLYLGFENSRYFMSTSTKVEMRRYINRINRDDGGRTIFHVGSRIFDEEYENSLFLSNDFTPVLFLSFSNRWNFTPQLEFQIRKLTFDANPSKIKINFNQLSLILDKSFLNHHRTRLHLIGGISSNFVSKFAVEGIPLYHDQELVDYREIDLDLTTADFIREFKIKTEIKPVVNSQFGIGISRELPQGQQIKLEGRYNFRAKDLLQFLSTDSNLRHWNILIGFSI